MSAMFHDMGLTPKHSSATDRFEVDGANAAREFLRQHKIALYWFSEKRTFAFGALTSVKGLRRSLMLL